MAISPESKSNLDTAPEPATPEELKRFKDLVLAKVKASGKAVSYKEPISEVHKTAAKWALTENIEVHAEIGAMHEPEYVEILTNEHLGQVQGVDTYIRKHFRYFPTAGISEYEEDLAEYFRGKRLIPEEVQRMKEQMPDIDDESLDEELKRMIEHARDFSERYRGSGIPPVDSNNLDEAVATLNQCNPANAAQALHFV